MLLGVLQHVVAVEPQASRCLRVRSQQYDIEIVGGDTEPCSSISFSEVEWGARRRHRW